MPTYEYRCLKCRKKFERLQRMTEAALTRCPHCKGKVERLISAGTGLIFKGSGFYSTDYKKQPESPSASLGINSKRKAESKKPEAGCAKPEAGCEKCPK